jgi:hypothetical protein
MTQRLLSGESQLTTDQFTQAVLYLPMAWHGSLPSIGWVAVDIVSLAISQEEATGLDQLADEGLTLHTSSSTCLTCEPVRTGSSIPVRIKS